MKKTPSQSVKDRFGEKKKLVDALQQFVKADLWVARENKEKGLARISNAKLIRLFDTFTAVQSKWGTRAKLIDAIVDAEGRQHEKGFRDRLDTWPVPRLFDRYKSASRRSGQPAPATAPKREAKPAAAKVEAAAAAPAKKSATKAAAPKASAEKKPAKKAAK